MAVTEAQPAFVLSTSAAGWAVDELLARRTHPWFPAYLWIRRTAGERQAAGGINPAWGDLGVFLRTPGGPPNKPHLRPFWNQTRDAGQAWLNANLAGSYSRGSLRSVQARVIDVEDSGFSLKDGHWELALEHLLYGKPISAVALAAFLYRDFGFVSDGPQIGPLDLLALFRGEFLPGAIDDGEEFDALYNSSIPDRIDWFDAFTASENGS